MNEWRSKIDDIMDKKRRIELEESIKTVDFDFIYAHHLKIFRLDGIEWKESKRFPGYWVSWDGYVCSSINNKKPRILKPWYIAGKRYPMLSFGYDKNGKRLRESIHRLVAEEFCEKRNKDHNVVRHIDDNPRNNKASNLVWGTQKENIDDMRKNGNMFMIPVYCYETNKLYDCATDAVKELKIGNTINVGKTEVCNVCKGKSHNAYGYHFCYANEKDYKLKYQKEWFEDYDPYKALICIEEKTGKVLYFKSRREASRKLGVPNCCISSCITGYIKHTHGYKFIDINNTEEVRKYVSDKQLSRLRV